MEVEERLGHAFAQHALGEGDESAIGRAEFARQLLQDQAHESRRLVE